jgi:hypothetical protein
MAEEFDHEYMKNVIENIKKNFENVQNKQKENKYEEEEDNVDSEGFSITLYFDNSDSSREILFELAKKSLISNRSIKEVVMGIVVENTIY